MKSFGWSKTYRILNQMIDEAAAGEFEESEYDETELSKLEVKWKQFLTASKYSREQVETERKNIQKLVSDISHQTKTPLANILLYTELLEEQGLEDEGKELGRHIKEQSKKLEFLIQALVKTSQLESGSIRLYPKEQSIQPMLESLQVTAMQKAKEKQMEILLENQEEITACFDRKWTEEAVYNVIDNAIKYSEVGSKITINSVAYELFADIAIEDEGIGIKTKEIPHLFERFYRGSEVRSEEGVGVGLFLTREILNGQKGYITVKQKEKGSVFHIFLPRK